MAASKFWQVRCWIAGRTHRRSARTQSLRVAQSFARGFYEQLLALATTKYSQIHTDCTDFLSDKPAVKPKHTFAALAAQLVANEQSRVDRGEIALDSLQVLRNRLDAHILPRWGKMSPAEVDFSSLLTFTQFLSASFLTTTVSQYLIAVRKVLNLAVSTGVLDKLPEFPKIKVKSTPRGAFTPTEYWRILRTARQLQGTRHPDSDSTLRKNYRLRSAQYTMPFDVAWAIGFMVNSFIRPGDLVKLRHRHVEVVKAKQTYLRLTLPETKLHAAPIVTLLPAVRIYRQICQYQTPRKRIGTNDYLFLPDIPNRRYAMNVLSYMFNWVLQHTGLKLNPHGNPRSLYSLRHSAITFRLLYGQGIDLVTLARNARTSVEVINNHYASTVTGEQNIAMLQSKRT